MNSGILAALGLADWTPIRLFWNDGEPCVDWCRLPAAPFAEPFFEQTVGQAMTHPARLLFRQQTSTDVLEAIGRAELSLETGDAAEPVVRPAGFVFHVSRCGSTLISQMLAALARNVVLSEPTPVEQVLTAPFRDPRVTRERRIAWLRGLIAALCQPRRGGEQQAFIKFECLSVLDHELIAEAFPEVPRVFLYRDPVEVLVSLQRSLPAQMLPGAVDPRRLGIEPTRLPEMSLEEYGARVLAPVYAAGAALAEDPRVRLVNFAELPAAVWAAEAGLFPVAWTADEIERMQRTVQRNAKYPQRLHVADSQEKQRVASDEVRAAAQRWLQPAYVRLEAQRQAAAERQPVVLR